MTVMTTLPSDARAWLHNKLVRPRGAVRRLAGSSTAHLFAFDEYVLRWYTDTGFLQAEPDAILREVAALTAMETGPVPAPRLIAWSSEPPAVLMMRLSGRLPSTRANPTRSGACCRPFTKRIR